MTIATQSRTAGPFECNGSTTVYPFTFKVFTASDVSVIFRNTANGDETKLVLNIDYTVALNSNQNANPGGSITINGPAYESGNTLTLTSELQYLQPTDLTNQGGFYPKVISDALDRLTIFAQQLRGLADRALKFPISDGNLDGTLPGKDQRRGTVLAFHETTGLPVSGPSIASTNTVAANSAAIETVAANIADVNTVADYAQDVADFNARYQGPHPTDPTTRNDGSPLQDGDLYFNTENDRLRAYTGSRWSEANTGSVSVQQFTGNGATTSFQLNTAPDSENVVQVFIGGVYQSKTEYDLTGTNGDILTFTAAPPNGTSIEAVTFSVLPLGIVDANQVQMGGGLLLSDLAQPNSTLPIAGTPAGEVAYVTELGMSQGAGAFAESGITVDSNLTVDCSVKSLKTYCNGVAESASLSSDYNYTKLNGEGGISTTAASNRAWLAALTGANWVQVLTPFGVIMGDSIAEGHPGVHGRLHQSYVDPTFNDTILNAYGSPAYALAQRTGMHWYNAGIGGQTSAEILTRFDRDALGQTVAVGDGRPNSTLPAKPIWIWVNAGINDVSALTSTSVTKANLLKMAVKAINAGVNIGFNTIGPVDSHNATQRAMQDDINNFILTVLPLYGCHTFDFHAWFVDPSDATRTNPRFSADGVHPNKTGYNNYVARLLSDCNLPIYLNGLAIESYGETYSANYRAPTTIEFEDNVGLSGQFGMSNQFGVFNPNLNLLTSALLKVYVRNGVDGINGARHSGFSNIHPIIGYRSQKQEPSAGVEKALGGHIVKVSGTWQATTTTQALGVSSVSATSTGVWVTFTVGVNRPMVSMTGSSTAAIYAATPQGAGNTQVRVRVFDRTTGAEIDPTTMPDNTGFNLLAFGVV